MFFIIFNESGQIVGQTDPHMDFFYPHTILHSSQRPPGQPVLVDGSVLRVRGLTNGATDGLMRWNGTDARRNKLARIFRVK